MSKSLVAVCIVFTLPKGVRHVLIQILAQTTTGCNKYSELPGVSYCVGDATFNSSDLWTLNAEGTRPIYSLSFFMTNTYTSDVL